MRYDVAVIGGGPAGSVAAASLARLGAKVALIDATHPREKPCGGGLTGRAIQLVDHLVPLKELDAVQIRSAKFLDTPRRRDASVALPSDRNALMIVDRAAFDSALFDAAERAGARIVPARVLDVVQGQPHVISTSGGDRIAAQFVIGADGANSLARRRFSTPFRRDQISIGTGFYAYGVTSDEIVLELVNEPSGYIWSFPRRHHLAIGICSQATRTTVGQLRDVLARWIQASGIAGGARLEPYSWPIPSLSAHDFDHVAFCGPGWLTVGDAAGLVDPITREGIYFALQSALFAAEALGSSSTSPSREYAARVRDEIAGELKIAASLKAGFFQPEFTRPMFDALASSARLRAVMADLIAGTQPYRTLKRRLLGTFQLRLAWRFRRAFHRTA